MIENIVRMLSHPDAAENETVMQRIARATHEVQRPVFYSIAIIIVAYLPIFSYVRIEGVKQGIVNYIPNSNTLTNSWNMHEWGWKA